MRKQVCLVLVLAIVTVGRIRAQDTAPPDPGLELMRDIVKAAEVSIVDKEGRERLVQLQPQPAFRYSDEARRIHDAALWVWLEQGRPVALHKLENAHHRATGEALWVHCFTSLSEGNVRARWDPAHEFESRQPALSFAVIQGAAAPVATAKGRSLQLRQIARRFSATIIQDPARNDRQEMRLLARPILEYPEPTSDLPLGGVFGLASYGTNPDVLIVIESRTDDSGQPAWSFAATRMTNGGVQLRYDGRDVWTVDHVEPVPQKLDTWTFFYVPRKDE